MNNIKLPGKDCGACGCATCAEFLQVILAKPDEVKRCIHLKRDIRVCSGCQSYLDDFDTSDWNWCDRLGRQVDFVLGKFPGDIGSRETVHLFNPLLIERFDLKKGSVIYGIPEGISCGCPVTHVGKLVEDPDELTGTCVWNVVGQMAARDGGINIGKYNTTAYQGLVIAQRPGLPEIKVGQRLYFLPKACQLQWRHWGVVNDLKRVKDGLQIRLEGLLIA